MLTLPRLQRCTFFSLLLAATWFFAASAARAQDDRLNAGSQATVAPNTVETDAPAIDDDRVKLPDETVMDSLQDPADAWIVEPGDAIACDDVPFAEYCPEVGDLCCPKPLESSRLWLNAEYLYWHMRGSDIPPLVTTSDSGTTRSDAGLLGQPSTIVLLGEERFNDDWQSGGRFGIGFWLDHCRDIGLDFSYTTLGDHRETFSRSTNELAILARPFFNVDSNTQDARIIGFPSEASGSIQVAGTTQYDVYEVLIRQTISRDPITPTYLVYGYRSARLDDSMTINDSSLSLTGATSGSSIQTLDQFRAKNVFHGFEAGLLTSIQWTTRSQINIEGKVAFGETEQTAIIAGQSTSTTALGASTTTAGGLLTQSSNIGTFESNSHGVLQDLTIRLRTMLRPGVHGTIGYTIHRWNDVVRAGEMIDLSVNPTQIPPGTLVGEARPRRLDAKSNFIAQGISFGIECIW